ncbi:site-specific tyrosine recombinase XerC [Rikenella microfusus]|uniref:Site-specific tyrosine recombinase XerC n=2 Tax=Rikenella microfusus TaxID=28139 RepID=A0A379MSK8_9BACT|nr:site-specific tyrosine recombinase XerC [Rikenella microfusus]
MYSPGFACRIPPAMFKFAKDNVSVLTVLDTRRSKANGLYPIKVQVVHQRAQKYYSTGKELSPEDWKRLPMAKNRELKEIRQSIENSFSLVKAAVEALAEKGDFSFDTLNLRLGKATGGTVNTAFKTKIAALKKEERIGTMLYYDNILKNVEAFGGPKIAFEQVSVDWLKRYEKFLLKDKNHTTVGMHMRAIRAIMNEAKKAGIIRESQYPFGKDRYEIQTGESRKKALTLEQIRQVVTFTDGRETTEKYRDLWFFMYLCNGINTADLVKLKYKNIVDGEICFVRQKTERTTKTIKEIRAIVTPEMQTIIAHWGNDRKPDHYIFPCITGSEDALKQKLMTKDLTKRINKRMKFIGETLGIDGISTYTARHSYATVLKRSGANIAYISESLGHNDLKTTEHYLASFEKEERQKNAALLTNFGEKV